jgi:glycine dehydrogenase subunit 1
MSKIVYPYIPNTAPETRNAMLAELGVKDAEELYREIPERLRFRR